MQKNQPQFKIYPSLLDAYSWYASSESEEAEIDLINKINRVSFHSDLAEKGTWFNQLIDLALIGNERFGICYLDGVAHDIVERLQGAVSQQFTSTTIMVNGNCVELYGYYDYLLQDRVIDLKTTSKYDLGKYKGSMQLHFYPVSLIDNGCQINEFEFLVTDFESVFSETYKVDYNTSKQILINKCAELINFLEAKKHLITDLKIFGIDTTEKVTIHDSF